jgi:hypothetical protein
MILAVADTRALQLVPEDRAIMKPEPTVGYQNILRAIGQGLENLDVTSFELEVLGNHYVVSGKCKKANVLDAPKARLTKSFLRFFGNVNKMNTTDISELERFNFDGLRFTRCDIELLDRKGKVLRSSRVRRPPNPDSIAQVLRMTGAYLDLNHSQLQRLSWHDRILTLWHFNVRGIEAKEEFTSLDLYDVWLHQWPLAV